MITSSLFGSAVSITLCHIFLRVNYKLGTIPLRLHNPVSIPRSLCHVQRIRYTRKVNLFNLLQVGELLDALGLQQYKAIFKEEEIDGEVFVNLTDEILESNLYINSPQDRMKLMRVIQGSCAIPVYLIPIKQ